MANFLINNNFLIGTSGPDTPIISDPIYEPLGAFSINASNQLIGKLWVTKNGQKVYNNLGTASYSFYDSLGNAVGSLSENNIIADVNGDYIITPVLSTSLLDLSLYTVKIDISVDSQLKRGQMGIPTGE